MENTYIVADVETSGLKASAKVVELAFWFIDEDLNILSKHHSLIDPEIPIEAGASGIHGITNADVSDSPTIQEYFSLDDPSCFGRKIPGNVIMVAHNATFDHRFLYPWFEKDGGSICTLRLAKRYYPESDNHKLQTLRYHLGLEAGDAHSADGDVQACYSLLKRLMGELELPLSRMLTHSHEPQFVHICPLPKYKGRPTVELPADYLRWCLGNLSLDSDLIYTFREILKVYA